MNRLDAVQSPRSKQASWLCAALLLALAAPAWAADPVTVFLDLGVNASAADKWDGSIEVFGGELVSLESRHFEEDSAVTGPNAWKASVRREAIDGFPKVNYNEMSPAELPATLFAPVGLHAVIEPQGSTRVEVRTAQGNFAFRLEELSLEAKPFLEGRALVSLTPAVEKLTSDQYEDDEAAIAKLPNGDLAVAWVGYRDRGDRVFVRTLSGGAWSEPEEASPAPGDFFRVSLGVDGQGGLLVFWSARDGAKWDIWSRRKAGGSWSGAQKVSADGSNTFHRAAGGANGDVLVAWQSFRGASSDIHARRWRNGAWGEEIRVSDSAGNDWEPFVAAGPDGAAAVVWDSYDKNNYDVFVRTFGNDGPGPIQQLTTSPRFQAHATAAYDPQGRLWVAWDESGVNWGKDQGFLITPPVATPLHQERTLRVAMWDGAKWQEPKKKIDPYYVYRLYPNFENPQIGFDARGVLNVLFRHWTRKNAYGIGSPLMWENFVTRFDGEGWTRPAPLAHSAGSIEKRPALTRDDTGDLHAAWMTDERPFQAMIPGNAEIYYAKIGSATAPPAYGAGQFVPFSEPYAEEIPVHPFEAENVKAIREHVVDAGAKKYKIYRGDMHRHTDVSQDFKYDGSLIEVYRYALDAAGFDYIVPTDHQLGYDQEFTWWQDEKLKDLFHVPGRFVPLFGYERSVNYPNGHRNVIFAKRGTRTLPVDPVERRGAKRTGPVLYPYLKANNGISMPHSSGTAQGTDFGDNDPELEPLIEIFQGYRASYEYMDAPLAASPQRLREQRSGFNPLGYYWDALAKGYKLGVQASSDHWSTHISYAMIVAEDFTRDSMFEAIQKRHAYAATDNIVLDFQAQSAEGGRYIMGDIIQSGSDQAPTLEIQAVGTDRIKQLVIVKNQQIIYERRPNADSIKLRFRDTDYKPGSNYYYVRVLQNNGMVAWSSPIWVE
ncbi:MAG: DUF3604 domain-containing protein [Acidobacteria bacterium]|nr:DUF3604 domain-containing protein [Acidobacteriota bacterium]